MRQPKLNWKFLTGLLVLFAGLFFSQEVSAAGLEKLTRVSSGQLDKVLKNQKNVLVVDLRNQSAAVKFSVVSIQGLVNSGRPTLFVLLEGENEVRWVEALTKKYKYKFHLVEGTEIISYFSKKIGKQVIYDPAVAYTINLATTIAGLEGAVMTETDLGVTTVFDCHGKWANRLEAYQWGIKNLLPKCNKESLAFLHEVIPDLRDIIIREKYFVINLDPINDKDQIAAINNILDQYPSQTIVLGWATHEFADASKGQNNVSVEVALVSLLSKKNDFLVAADFARNLSFYKGIKIEKQLTQSLPQKMPEYSDDNSYVSLIVSDGDNLQYDLNAMRALWEDRSDYKIPIGWTIAPLMVRYGPAVLDIYYSEAAKDLSDEFVCGPSGYGYVHPSQMDPAELEKFAVSTKKYNDLCSLKSVVIIDEGGMSKERLEQTLKPFTDNGIDALWMVGMSDQNGVVGSGVYFSEDARAIKDMSGLAKKVNTMAKYKRFIMVYVHAWDCTPTMLTEFMGKIDPRVKVVLPFQMAQLYKDHSDKMNMDDGSMVPLLKPGKSVYLKTDGTDENELFYLQDKGTPIDGDHRYVDAVGQIRYRYKIENLTKVRMKAELANNYVVEYSFDDKTYVKLLASEKDIHTFENQKVYNAEFAVPTANSMGSMYIRFTDGSKNDGWGPSIWNLEVFGE